MKAFLILLLVCVVQVTLATRRGAIQESPPAAYEVLSSHKRSDINDETITFTIGIKQRNLDKLETMFWEVSDPKSAQYGNHLDFTGMIDLVGASQESIDSIVNFLQSSGISSEKVIVHKSRDFIKVEMTVAEAERVFEAPMTVYVHKRSGTVVASMDNQYSLPDDVSAHVDFVSTFNSIHGAVIENMGREVHKKIFTSTTEVKLNKINKKSMNNNNDNHNEINKKRATANAPVISQIYTTDGGMSISAIFIFCFDGSAPTVSTFALSCSDGTTVKSLDGIFTNTVTGTSLGNVSFPVASCSLCSENTNCAQTSNVQTDVVCSSQQISGLSNYLPWTVSITTTFSDNSVSDAAVSGVYESTESITPSVISRQYNIPSGTTVTQSSNSQALLEFEESFLLTDAQAYFAQNGLSDMTDLIHIVNDNVVNDTSAGFGEGILDIDCIMGTARNCPTYYWGEANTASGFLTWMTDVLNSNSPPLVHSASWGGPELDFFVSNSDVTSRTNTEFMKAGVRGLSIIVSSGDAGVQFTDNSSLPAYSPTFPASSPYVTSVGATVLAAATATSSCYNSDGEYTCTVGEQVASPATGSSISSGGGFSDVFSRPSYQDSVVSAYVNSLSSSQLTGVNSAGRGFPDVAAVGHNIPIIYNGQSAVFDGTSASSPFFAGMVTLWNDIRLSKGLSSLGFLNTLLYSMDASNFNDVTVGSNNCVELACTTNGFAAAAGWDPVTGLGSPNFQKISSYIASLTSLPSVPPDSTSSSATTSPSSPSPSSSGSTTEQATSSGSLVVVSVFTVAIAFLTIM